MVRRASDDPSLEELLAPPTSFSREHATTDLWRPYSIKQRRRVALYSRPAYHLWVLIESDPEIRVHNFEVPQIALATGDQVVSASPTAVSVSKRQVGCLHVLKGNDGEDPLPWHRWSAQRDLSVVVWTPESLYENKVRLANLEKLLRRVSRSGYVPDRSLEASLLERLRVEQKISIRRVLAEYAKLDAEEVITAIFMLIVDRRVMSDIDERPLGLLTGLSPVTRHRSSEGS